LGNGRAGYAIGIDAVCECGGDGAGGGCSGRNARWAFHRRGRPAWS